MTTAGSEETSSDFEQYRRGMKVSLGSTERIRRLSARSRSTPQTLCLHRARAYTSAYRETGGEPLFIKRAQAFRKSLEDLPVTIDDDALIVGRRSCRVRSVPVVPECHGGWLLRDIDTLPTRPQDPFNVPAEQMAEIKAMLPWWQGRSLYHLWKGLCPPEIAVKVMDTGWADSAAGLFMLGYHFTPPWERLLGSGLQSFEEQVQAKLAGLDYADPGDMGNEHFLKALLMVVSAIKDFAERHGEEAARLAERTVAGQRKQELLNIAEACRRVPYRGARDFREAIQSVWFMHSMVYLEGTGPSCSLGRFDQYMYPFYKADVQAGRLTEAEAQELIENLFINLTDNLSLYDSLTVENAAGFTQYQTLNIGGIDALGRDASNELSYLCLDAAKSVRSTQPDIILLCSPRETPYRLKMKAAELTQLGLGLPKFINTETTKTELMEMGFDRDQASVGWIRGCSEPYGPGSCQYGHAAGTFINAPLSLETALFNGYKHGDAENGREPLGPATGDPRDFSSFDQLMDAFKRQLSQQIHDAHISGSYMELAQAGSFPLMVQSLLTDDCVGRCKAANAGGARLTVGPGMPFTGGWVKKLVFEDERISMADLLGAMNANFEGYEDIQELLVKGAPKFGNDIDYADELAREVFQFATDEVKKHTGIFGNKNTPSTAVSVSHISHGAFVWATPDGRLASKPVSDNVGPMDQMDKAGPVAHINSVAKLGLDRQMGTIHNLYLTNVDTDEKKHRMIDLIDSYHEKGGHHLQINCIDKSVLLDAQKHPEKYPTLMVRVAGYVAYFTELSTKIQDYVISRTSVEL
jgi:pyruvate formate-lyase/glycerol dehydratase family glycyl radical enzyme